MRWLTTVEACRGLVAGQSPERMLGHKTVTAGIAGPEIADDVVGNKSGSFRSHHGVRANRAGRQIASARVGVSRDGRQDFSNCRHRDLLAISTCGYHTPICLTF